MATLSPLEKEVAQLIIDSLQLEDLDPDGIDPEAPLFRDGLGLDSIDALELSLSITLKYGFQIRSDDSDTVDVFSNLRSLSRHIERRRTK